MLEPIKCLSLWQPWSSLMVHGVKLVETRSWPVKHRGRLLIHAAKVWSPAISEICRGDEFRATLAGIGYHHPRLSADRDWWLGGVQAKSDHFGPALPGGCVVGEVTVEDCVPTEDVHFADGETADYARIGMGGGWQVPGRERPFGDYSPGRYAIVCRDAKRYAIPVPLRGLQGVFAVDAVNVPMEFR